MEYEIEIPDGVRVSTENRAVTVSGTRGGITKIFTAPSVTVKVQDNTIAVCSLSERKKDIAIAGSIHACIKNMIYGVEKGYEYHLKIFHAHFPMNVSAEGNRVKIDNFLGERYPRYAVIVEGTSVKIQADTIVVTGIDKEKVGQTAGNLEQATRVRKRDPRVFQDGIYLFERNGVRLK